MSRQVLLSTRSGDEHPEAPITQMAVQSALDWFEAERESGASPSFDEVDPRLAGALDLGGNDERFHISLAIQRQTGGITLDGTTGAARLKY